MARQPKKPIPLDYAKPGRSRPGSGRRNPKVSDSVELTAPVAVFESPVQAEIEFATRAMREKKIGFSIKSRPYGRVYGKRIMTLFVEALLVEAAKAVIDELLERRRRVGELPRQNFDGLRTRSEGGTWPEPTDWSF